MFNSRFNALVGATLIAALTRLIPHPPNFVPIGAMALFGGTHFGSKRAAFAVPFAAMYLSDVVLGHFVYGFGWYHATMPFVYLSFAQMVCLGFILRRRPSPGAIVAAAVGGAVLFYLISNFGAWLMFDFYPRSVEGLFACYVAAIPYLGNTLAANLVYCAVLFGGFALAQRRFPAGPEPPIKLTART